MPDPRQQDIEKFLKKWLTTPEALPDEFKSWLISFIQQNPNLLLSRESLPGIAGKPVSAGNGSTTWPGGSPLSNNSIFPHKLGKAPVAVLITPQQDAGNGANLCCATYLADATNIAVSLRDINNANVAVGSPATFSWLAIG